MNDVRVRAKQANKQVKNEADLMVSMDLRIVIVMRKFRVGGTCNMGEKDAFSRELERVFAFLFCC